MLKYKLEKEEDSKEERNIHIRVCITLHSIYIHLNLNPVTAKNTHLIRFVWFNKERKSFGGILRYFLNNFFYHLYILVIFGWLIPTNH